VPYTTTTLILSSNRNPWLPDRSVTLFNCFVMGTIGDDLASIFEMYRQADSSDRRTYGGVGLKLDYSGQTPTAMLWLVAQRGALAAGVHNFLGHAEQFFKTPVRRPRTSPTGARSMPSQANAWARRSSDNAA
jgi:hypothetical protein